MVHRQKAEKERAELEHLQVVSHNVIVFWTRISVRFPASNVHFGAICRSWRDCRKRRIVLIAVKRSNAAKSIGKENKRNSGQMLYVILEHG